MEEKLDLKLEEEKKKMKEQYEEEYNRMQLMIKIQAKQIEMLKIQQQNTSDSASVQNSGANSGSQTAQKRPQGGDTGGPPQNPQSNKKNDLVINMPDITSPRLIQHIIDDDENLMPDIIKEIRKTPNRRDQISFIEDLSSKFANQNIFTGSQVEAEDRVVLRNKKKYKSSKTLMGQDDDENIIDF